VRFRFQIAHFGWSSVNLLLGFTLVMGLSGCGKNEQEEAAFKEPVTVEQAASVLDLSTLAVVKGAKPPWPRGVASLSYEAPGDVKSVFDFHRKEFLSQGWKELANSSVTAEAAGAMFARHGFVVSVSVFPREPNTTLIMIQNHGNIRPRKLPVPPNVKPVYVGDISAMYVTDATVAATADACHELLLADGWVPYGEAGDSAYYKQNAIRIEATVSSAPAQGGKTMISYSSLLMSADLPAPPDTAALRYMEQTRELSFETTVNREAVVDFYKRTLAKAKWAPTLEHTVQIAKKDEMIFRNPAKDMLTLAMPPAREGKVSVSLQYQSAAEIAELDRHLKEHEPEIRAKAKAQQEEEDRRWEEEHHPKPLPKVAVTLPAEISGLEQTKDEIKFNVGNGKAKAVVETWRRQFRDGGWKENIATVDAMTGVVSLSKENQSLTINYTDTGVMPAEVSLSAMRVEIEITK